MPLEGLSLPLLTALVEGESPRIVPPLDAFTRASGPVPANLLDEDEVEV